MNTTSYPLGTWINSIRYIKIAFLTITYMVTGALAYDAYSVRENENAAKAINSANISLAQAIITAEKHVNGKATRAHYEHDEHNHSYRIDVFSYAKIFDVTIDAHNGIVISSIENKPDDDES